jgi:hypothetical protein
MVNEQRCDWLQRLDAYKDWNPQLHKYHQARDRVHDLCVQMNVPREGVLEEYMRQEEDAATFDEMVEAVGLAELRLQEFYQLTGDAADPLLY